jgi:two-component system, OmpR family, sensor histidine kinase KdpD
LKKDWCDVSDIIGVAVQQLGKCLEERALTLNLATDLPLIQGDFVLLEQVIVNLLDNACTYTPVGTAITIEAFVVNKTLHVTISDNGQGIPPQDLERIFHKFYRLPGSASGGTGLGLSICRGLVEAHSGILTAENIADGGVCFIIKLPLRETAPTVQEAHL